MSRHIHTVYFTCADHFGLLPPSIKSVFLASGDTGIVKGISVFCDCDDYFSTLQEDWFRSVGGIEIRKTAVPMSWGGVKTIENELLGFYEVARNMSPDDYIMNIDSDLVFLSSAAFPKVVESDADFVGQPVAHVFHAQWDYSVRSQPVTFMQGACYFLRVSFVKDIIRTYGDHRDEIIRETMDICKVPSVAIPPDVALSRILARTSGKLFPMDFFVNKEASVLHMEMTKDSCWRPFASLLGIEDVGKHKIVKSREAIADSSPEIYKFRGNDQRGC